MGLEERDYMREEHYPSCTCVACCRRRYERAARLNWCDRHDRSMGPSGCQLCRMEGLTEEGPDGAGDPPALAGKPAGYSWGQRSARLGYTLRGILSRKQPG